MSGRSLSLKRRGQSPRPFGERGKGSRSSCFSNLEFDFGMSGRSLSLKRRGQSPSPLGRGGKGADFHAFQILSSTLEFQVAAFHLNAAVGPLAPMGRGGKGSGSSCISNSEFDFGMSGRSISLKRRGQSPRPFGERVRVRGAILTHAPRPPSQRL